MEQEREEIEERPRKKRKKKKTKEKKKLKEKRKFFHILTLQGSRNVQLCHKKESHPKCICPLPEQEI